jgi:hypothetical protein
MPTGAPQRFNFFRDNNGMFTVETTESINPLWQADYATVCISRLCRATNAPFPDKDVFLSRTAHQLQPR